MVIIYTPEITTRFEYTLKIIFSEVLGIAYEIIDDPKIFDQSKKIKLAYSSEQLPNSISIKPSGLLSESGIEEQAFSSDRWGELPVIFSNVNNPIPFDLFSAVFYLVTRYEEYLPFTADSYGRYPAETSLNYREHFLRLPIVELWCKKLTKLLGIEKECKSIHPANYKFQLTIDIDQPWLFRNKGVFYEIGSLVRELIRFNFADYFNRLFVILRLKSDPGDTFEFLLQTNKKLPKPIKYFVLMQGRGEYDKNRSVNSKQYKQLLRELDQDSQLGIHPSFISNASIEILKKETNDLAAILDRKILISRQHYLKLSFPVSFTNLMKQGIQEDFSLGYSTQTGFRSGISRSFNFFNLRENKETELRLTPLIVMDRTLKDQQSFTPEQAISEFEFYAGQIREVGGAFVCLWHNDALSDSGEWKGWKAVFEQVIAMNSK